MRKKLIAASILGSIAAVIILIWLGIHLSEGSLPKQLQVLMLDIRYAQGQFYESLDTADITCTKEMRDGKLDQCARTIILADAAYERFFRYKSSGTTFSHSRFLHRELTSMQYNFMKFKYNNYTAEIEERHKNLQRLKDRVNRWLTESSPTNNVA